MHLLPRLALATLSLAFLAAAPAPPAAERIAPGQHDGFATDNAGGCWIWMGGLRAGSTDITARWSGACPDGPAEGEGRSVMTWREGGIERQMIYEGPLRRGKAEGRGRLGHYRDGEIVQTEEGEYRDDKLVSGRIEVIEPGLIYEGGWRGQHPEGQGRLRLNGRSFEGEWQNGCLQTPQGWLSFTRPATECEGRPT